MSDTKTTAPTTIDEAVDYLSRELSLRDMVEITRMNDEELNELRLSLGMLVRSKFRLWALNTELLEACRKIHPPDKSFTLDSASTLIVNTLWARLQQTHSLRIIK